MQSGKERINVNNTEFKIKPLKKKAVGSWSSNSPQHSWEVKVMLRRQYLPEGMLAFSDMPDKHFCLQRILTVKALDQWSSIFSHPSSSEGR